MGPDEQPPALIQCLPQVGLDPARVPALLAAEQFSREQLALARACLSDPQNVGEPGGLAVFAFGSLGRFEA
jgi:hypothetical protein